MDNKAGDARLDRESRTVEAMITMYCRHHHKLPKLCPECANLLEHAKERISRCRFGHEKPTCDSCIIHCYSPSRREQIRKVMKWAGPRMIYAHPLMAVMHLMHKKAGHPGTQKLAKLS